MSINDKKTAGSVGLLHHLIQDPTHSTFMYDETLPSLPLPSLENTMSKYLTSCRPLLTPDQLAETERVASEFLRTDGPRLQATLQARAERTKNWLEEWWLHHAYLTHRRPLVPLLNTGGPQTLNMTQWPPKEEHVIKYAALFVYTTLYFFQYLREEKIGTQASGKGEQLSMDQFRVLFNTCRIPGRGADSIRTRWRTAREGRCPQHLAVLCRGHVWQLMPWHEDGGILSLPELECQLKLIRDESSNLGTGPGVGALTADHREEWAKNRSLLQSVSAGNQRSLQAVEDSIFVLVLDQARPGGMSQCGWEALCGDTCNRWADKSLTGIVTADGYVANNNDHSPLDAMALVVLTTFQRWLLQTLDVAELRAAPVRPHLPPPLRLEFQLNAELREAIAVARHNSRKLNDNLVVNFEVFKGFGKNWMKIQKVHPDALVQMSLQLAYYRAHKKMAPTYETATTRQFYHGRTETMRSCTSEAKDFVLLMQDESASTKHRSAALRAACATHDRLMRECQRAQGVDRHLMGLYLTAVEEGDRIPDLFTNFAFSATGGGGNYVLSTSTIGYTDTTGGAAPMVPHGYGCFYSMLPQSINLFVSSYRDGGTLPASQFSRSICDSFDSIRVLLDSDKVTTAML